MGKRVIKMTLDSDDVSRVIDEITEYKESLKTKTDLFRKRVADEIAAEAQMGFNSSMVDDIIKGGSPKQASVDVTVSDSGDITVVIANGDDAAWCEFGAGIYHNGSVGQSPNPNGSELGFTIGSYGKGFGSRKAWGYKDESDNLVITHGTPATMPMYKATMSVLSRLVTIAREVFG